jgi:type IV pilus assembly protein PilC
MSLLPRPKTPVALPVRSADEVAQLLAWQSAAGVAAAITVDDEAAAASALLGFNVSVNRRVKLADVVWLTGQLEVCQRAGLPISRSLAVLSALRKKGPVKAMIDDVAKHVADGEPLPVALRRYENQLGPAVCALVEAGEESGRLDEALGRAHALTESQLRLRRQITGAMTYPAVVVLFTVGLVAALLLFVVPQFADLYDQAGKELPAITRWVMAASDAAPFATTVVVAAIAGLFYAFRRARKDVRLGRLLHPVRAGIPVIGRLLLAGVNGRIAATMAGTLSAGVPLLNALGHASSGAGHRPATDALDDVRRRVADGSTLAAALGAHATVFNPMLVQLAAVGEDTGALPELLTRYAATTEDEVANAAQALTRLIEPALMVVIGSIVGVILAAMYLPIVDFVTQIK